MAGEGEVKESSRMMITSSPEAGKAIESFSGKRPGGVLDDEEEVKKDTPYSANNKRIRQETKQAQVRDYTSPSNVIRLGLSNLGPLSAMDRSLHVLFSSISTFLEQHSSTSTTTPIEIHVIEEAEGKYAAKLTSLSQELVHDPRFQLQIGQVTSIRTTNDATLAVHVLVAPCDRRLLPTADFITSPSIYEAAGQVLSNTARLLFSSKAEKGKAYAIKLPASSPLRASQGVQYVILALPPTGALDLSEDLPSDWQDALSTTYMAILNTFLTTALKVIPFPSSPPHRKLPSPASSITAAPSKGNEGDTNDSAASKGNEGDTNDSAAATAAAAVDDNPPPVTPAFRPPNEKPPQTAGWQGGLSQYLALPTALRPFIYMDTRNYMVIYDGYPKAKIHLLMVPKPSYLNVDALGSLRREHLDRLIKIHAEARRIADKLANDFPTLRLRLGYHGIPSLHPLHLHIISQDFDSPSLKTKKHWNSFTTSFFIEPQQIEANLLSQGRVVLDRSTIENLLKGPLRCHGCHATQTNMPTLKTHLTHCRRVQED